MSIWHNYFDACVLYHYSIVHRKNDNLRYLLYKIYENKIWVKIRDIFIENGVVIFSIYPAIDNVFIPPSVTKRSNGNTVQSVTFIEQIDNTTHQNCCHFDSMVSLSFNKQAFHPFSLNLISFANNISERCLLKVKKIEPNRSRTDARIY